MIKRLNRKTLLPPVALFFVCLLAYLPVCSFLFALKNDAFIYNFPNKFFFSQALHAGIIPLWNPYLNYGFPLYADPGFAWWQPITWIFGLIGYNPYTFTVEVVLYIYLSGLGMYWLGQTLNLERTTAFAIACMFMCSGFFVGNLQHINFLTCAAFLPWLTGTWLRYQKNPSAKNAIWCSVAAYFLCTGGHPAIPIAAAYFFLLLTILYYLFTRKEISIKPFVINQLRLLGCCFLFLAPLLLSYAQILPFYNRTIPVSQAKSLNVGFSLHSFLSFIFPFGTIKNSEWFGTDVSMRNAYFSLGGFILFLHVFTTRKKKALETIFLILGSSMLLLAAGGSLKHVLYENLPVLKFISTNGEFRLFSIFSFIICLSFRLNELVLGKELVVFSLQKWLKAAAIVLALACSIIALFVSWKLPFSNAHTTFAARVKFLMNHLSFEQTLWIATATAFVFCLFYLYSLYTRRLCYFISILIADLSINSWLLLPITGVSQHPVAEIQAIIDKSPKGFPIPNLPQGTPETKPITKEEEILIGNWYWYSKQIIYSPPIAYPSMLNATAAFLESGRTNILRSKPFVFLKNNNGSFTISKFDPTSITLNTTLSKSDTLVLLQNWFPGWKVSINKKDSNMQLFQNTFIQVPLTISAKEVRFRFTWF